MGISLENSFEDPGQKSLVAAGFAPPRHPLPAPQYPETFDGQNLKIRRKRLSR